MSSVGYYRYKVNDLTKGQEKKIYFFRNTTLIKTVTFSIRSFCSTQKLIKYLDRQGQYKFYAFNKFYEIKNNPRLLGKTNEVITSILTAQTNSKSLGFKDEKTISLVAEDVSESDLTLLEDLFISPRVYLYIGDGISDTASDWLQVDIKPQSQPIRRKKASSGKINIDIALPEQFSITML